MSAVCVRISKLKRPPATTCDLCISTRLMDRLGLYQSTAICARDFEVDTVVHTHVPFRTFSPHSTVSRWSLDFSRRFIDPRNVM